MANENDEYRTWAGPISGDEVQEINLLVIEKVIQHCDDTPFKNFDPRTDGDWETREFRPDLRTNRLFPTHGLGDANDLAALLAETASKRADLGDLRMITLRLKWERPTFENLDDHLRELSDMASKVGEDIQRRTKSHPAGLAQPILTTIHIRVADDGTERFDPHVHGIWHIAGADIDAAELKLREKFGQVWIDREAVRNLKRAAFYIAQGIIDYRGIRSWPDDAIKAVWNMAQVRMFRKAGWLASETRTVAVVPGDHDEFGPETAQDARVGHERGEDGKDHAEASATPQEGILGADPAPMEVQAWEGELFQFLPPYRASASVPNYTVRPASSKNLDLTRYPTLGDIQTTAIAIIESEQRDYHRTASEVFAAYKLDKDQVAIAIARTEAYFHISMFHPGIGWVPTPQGVAWAVKSMEALKLFDEAAVVGKSEFMDSHKDDQRLPDHLRRK